MQCLRWLLVAFGVLIGSGGALVRAQAPAGRSLSDSSWHVASAVDQITCAACAALDAFDYAVGPVLEDTDDLDPRTQHFERTVEFAPVLHVLVSATASRVALLDRRHATLVGTITLVL